MPVGEAIEHIRASHEQDLAMQVTPAELARLRESAPSLKVVDIRTREEFEAVSIEGALFFTQELMQEALTRWDRMWPIVIVDHQGTKAMDAAAYFAGHEFQNVRALRGGIDAWSLEADPSLPRYHLE